MIKRLLQASWRTYRNHGVVALAEKGRGYLSKRAYRIRHALHRHQESAEEKALHDEYNIISDDIFQITGEDISLSKTATSGLKPKDIKTATWFMGYFSHFGFAGIQTIFRFIEKLSIEGVENRIVIYDRPELDVDMLKAQIAERFPRLQNYQVIVFTHDKEKGIRNLPASDIAFCTIWVSAYLLLQYAKTKRKYYFIQDYEPFFYVAGSTFALAESTYRFGFRGIVNTPGLLSAVNQRHGMEGISFIPAIDHTVYYPDPSRNNKRVRIFFYARPLNPRNSFNLGLVTIKLLLGKYGKKIEIITAGSEWDESQYGLGGRITNLGLIKSIDDVGALYRSCDIGFSFMLTKHTSYQLLEYAASNMATVINYNEDHLWLHKDGENCLLAEPSPADMARRIGQLVDDPTLREKLAKNGRASLTGYTWDGQMDMLWNDIRQPER